MSQSPAQFQALTDRLRTVVTPECGDSEGALRVFAQLAKKHGWTEAVATFDRIIAEQIIPRAA